MERKVTEKDLIGHDNQFFPIPVSHGKTLGCSSEITARGARQHR